MAIIENSSALIGYSKATASLIKTENKPNLIEPLVPQMKSNITGEIVPWGINNLFPQQVLKECRNNTIIPQTLAKQAQIAYEAGIEYGLKEVVAGKEVFTAVKDERVDDFMRRSKIHLYLISALRNFYWFYNAFPDFVLTKDRSEIYSISTLKAPYCRWQKPDENTGVVKNCYVNADWTSVTDTNDKRVMKLPSLHRFSTPDEIREDNQYRYVYPISMPTEDESFYSLVDWNGLRTSGWLDVAQSIPKIKKAILDNQITLKYLIEVSSYWWNWKYPGFDTFKVEEKKRIMNEELERFESFVAGKEKSGSSIMVTFFNDPQFQKEYAGWKITAIDNKLKDGQHIADSNEASSHLMYALGIDPAIIGATPGSKMGSGSGSDKRVAFNIYSELVKVHQDIVLEPLSFIAEYNGWAPYHFRFKDIKSDEAQPSRSPMVEQTDALEEPNQQAN